MLDIVGVIWSVGRFVSLQEESYTIGLLSIQIDKYQT